MWIVALEAGEGIEVEGDRGHGRELAKQLADVLAEGVVTAGGPLGVGGVKRQHLHCSIDPLRVHCFDRGDALPVPLVADVEARHGEEAEDHAEKLHRIALAKGVLERHRDAKVIVDQARRHKPRYESSNDDGRQAARKQRPIAANEVAEPVPFSASIVDHPPRG